MTQCGPIIERLMLALSSTRVDCPIIESDDICAFASISARFSGSVGREYVDCARNYSGEAKKIISIY
jgi:hypothetical protein